MNARGLRQTEIHFDILNMAKQTGIPILCLQEMHLPNTDYTILKNEWNAEIFLSCHLTNALGIYTIAKSNFEHTFLKEINGPHDRYTVLDIDLPGIARFLLIHLNAPNQDIPEHARK